MSQLIDQLVPAMDNRGPQTVGAWSRALPPLHQELLSVANGFTVARGSMKVCGFDRNDQLDIQVWNHPDTWRFAWGPRADGYLFFAESGWGDQYAYGFDGQRIQGDRVYRLSYDTLTPSLAANTFDEFVRTVLLPASHGVVDNKTAATVNARGNLSPDQLWVFMPSPSITQVEDLNRVMTMSARTAMTLQGDTITQIIAAPDDAAVRGVEPYTDDHGRPRLRLQWAPSGGRGAPRT